MGSPEIKTPNFDLNESDASDVETEQPTKRVALRVRSFSICFEILYAYTFFIVPLGKQYIKVSSGVFGIRTDWKGSVWFSL